MSKKTQTPTVPAIEEAEKRLSELQAELGVELTVNLHFPMYAILPDELQLALAVIHKHDLRYVVSFVEKHGNQE